MAGHVARSLASYAYRWALIAFFRDPSRTPEERGVGMAATGAVVANALFLVLLPGYLLWLATGRGPLRPGNLTFTAYRRPIPPDVKRRMEEDREALRQLVEQARPPEG